MHKLRRLWDGAANAAQHKLKSSENDLRRTASDAHARAQQAAVDAADAAKRRLQLKADEAKNAAVKKAEDVQKVVMHKAEEARAAAAAKARGISNDILHNLRSNQEHAARQLRENAKVLQRSTSDTIDDLKTRAQRSAKEATGAAQERVQSSMSESAKRLKRTSSSMVEFIDPREKARRVRNKLMMLGFVGIFLYGFGSALPNAMAKYALEKTKIEETIASTEDASARVAKK